VFEIQIPLSSQIWKITILSSDTKSNRNTFNDWFPIKTKHWQVPKQLLLMLLCLNIKTKSLQNPLLDSQ